MLRNLGVLVGLLACLVGLRASAQEPILHYTFDEQDGVAIDNGKGDPANGVFEPNATRTNNTPGGFSPFALDLSAEGPESWVNGGDADKVDGLTQFTMTTWLNLQGLNSDQGGSGNVRLLAKQTDGAFDGFSWNLNNPVEGERLPSNFRLGMFIGGEDAFGFGQSSEDFGADNEWVFLAVTYDGTEDVENMAFYVGNETVSVGQLGDKLDVFAGQVKDTSERATVNVGFTDAAPGVDFAANGFQDDVRVYDTILTSEQLESVRLANLVSAIKGDIDGDGDCDVDDIDAIARAIRNGQTGQEFDLNDDQEVNSQDHHHLVTVLKNTWIGDVDLNGEFSSSDFVIVFSAGLYESGRAAGWGQGDWNGDGVFDSGDFVAAFSDGGFEKGPRQRLNAVPESGGLAVLIFAVLVLIIRNRR